MSIKVHMLRQHLHWPLLNCPLYPALSGRWKTPTYGRLSPITPKIKLSTLGGMCVSAPRIFPYSSRKMYRLQPHFLDFSMAPSGAVFIRDASWFPMGRQSGGVVAVLDATTCESLKKPLTG